MPRALLYYLAQAWTADRYRQAHRDAPAGAPSRARHPGVPRPPTASTGSRPWWRGLRTVLGGGRP